VSMFDYIETDAVIAEMVLESRAAGSSHPASEYSRTRNHPRTAKAKTSIWTSAIPNLAHREIVVATTAIERRPLNQISTAAATEARGTPAAEPKPAKT
jgi:hypothetical protein